MTGLVTAPLCSPVATPATLAARVDGDGPSGVVKLELTAMDQPVAMVNVK